MSLLVSPNVMAS